MRRCARHPRGFRRPVDSPNRPPRVSCGPSLPPSSGSPPIAAASRSVPRPPFAAACAAAAASVRRVGGAWPWRSAAPRPMSPLHDAARAGQAKKVQDLLLRGYGQGPGPGGPGGGWGRSGAGLTPASRDSQRLPLPMGCSIPVKWEQINSGQASISVRYQSDHNPLCQQI